MGLLNRYGRSRGMDQEAGAGFREGHRSKPLKAAMTLRMQLPTLNHQASIAVHRGHSATATSSEKQLSASYRKGQGFIKALVDCNG
jgi:hypothetical protein